MKYENENLFRQIPPYEFDQGVLVVRDKHPKKACYRICFVDFQEDGLLKSGGLFEKTIYKPIIEYYDEFHSRMGEKVSLIYVSEKGMDLVKTLGYNWFRKEVFNPKAWRGKKLSEGSESLVYRARLVGKDCVVKLINHKGIERMNQWGGGYQHFCPPDYLEKFGVTHQISKIIRQIEPIRPFKSFRIVSSPIEFVAGRDFLIEEYKRRSTVRHIVEFLDKKKDNMTRKGNIEFWEDWYKKFQKDILRLEELFFVVGYKRGVPFNQSDFSPQDWIITGFDRKSGKLKLSLIDQAPAPMRYAGAAFEVYEMERGARCEELLEKYKGDPVFKYLMEYSL
jgi:hypothetical protein